MMVMTIIFRRRTDLLMSQSTLSSQSHMFMTTFQARPGGHVVACAVPPAHWWYTWQLPGSGKWPWRYHCISAHIKIIK